MKRVMVTLVTMRTLGALLLLAMVVGIPCMDVTNVQLPSGEAISVLDVCSVSSVADSDSSPTVIESVFEYAPFASDTVQHEMPEQASSFRINFPIEKPPQR